MGGNQVEPTKLGGVFQFGVRSDAQGWKMQGTKSSKYGLRGQELVEFAIIFPLLMIIAFGVLDLGRAMHAAITITNVAREGARYGVDFYWTDPGLTDPLTTGYTEIIDVPFALRGM